MGFAMILQLLVQYFLYFLITVYEWVLIPIDGGVFRQQQ